METTPVITKAIGALKQGKLIAYPTEAVYGLGCDPFNESAVQALLNLKQRAVSKGVILIAASIEQLTPYLAPISELRMQAVCNTWPGPVTWIFPATHQVPPWISGKHHTVAVRVTAHPIARALCAAFGQPLLSTSANLAGHPPARDTQTLRQLFTEADLLMIDGETGGLDRPTPIYDAVTAEIIRA